MINIFEGLTPKLVESLTMCDLTDVCISLLCTRLSNMITERITVYELLEFPSNSIEVWYEFLKLQKIHFSDQSKDVCVNDWDFFTLSPSPFHSCQIYHCVLNTYLIVKNKDGTHLWICRGARLIFRVIQIVFAG